MSSVTMLYKNNLEIIIIILVYNESPYLKLVIGNARLKFYDDLN